MPPTVTRRRGEMERRGTGASLPCRARKLPGTVPELTGDSPLDALACRLKHEANLQLEHPRRIDVGERRNGRRRRAGSDDLAERQGCRTGVAVGGHRAAEDVAMVEEVEPFCAKDHSPCADVERVFRERRHILRGRAAERRAAEYLAADDRA